MQEHLILDCPHCGAMLLPMHETFCRHCGFDIDKPVPEISTHQLATQAKQIVQYGSTKAYPDMLEALRIFRRALHIASLTEEGVQAADLAFEVLLHHLHTDGNFESLGDMGYELSLGFVDVFSISDALVEKHQKVLGPLIRRWCETIEHMGVDVLLQRIEAQDVGGFVLACEEMAPLLEVNENEERLIVFYPDQVTRFFAFFAPYDLKEAFIKHFAWDAHMGYRICSVLYWGVLDPMVDVMWHNDDNYQAPPFYHMIDALMPEALVGMVQFWIERRNGTELSFLLEECKELLLIQQSSIYDAVYGPLRAFLEAYESEAALRQVFCEGLLKETSDTFVKLYFELQETAFSS